jgi:hypothetical protein
MKTQRALKACAIWLAYCVQIGWAKEKLDELEALWWKFHDDQGRITST